MSDFLNALLAGPTIPGTILLAVCAAYWLLLIAGAVDLDLLDLELDGGADADPVGTSWGMSALKFFNVNDVPLMIWLTLFAAAYVASSVTLAGWAPFDGSVGGFAAAVARDGAIALVATKLLTQPLRGKFDTVEPNKAETLVGRTCVITTSEVSDRFGQARLEAEGAPLLLNVRGPAGSFSKDAVALIAGYDGDRGVFLVEPVVVEPVTAAPSAPARREAV